ncbi:zinc finger HIT domain-containing protein 3 [Battus philenor]|uniref:zinc finger HIT domain-containing protein 3 n=1 Tax=Battus philenor TaxID=42288 RepID=UPI0035CE92AC
MPCCHCKNDSKYKCPTCRQPYCSVACYKVHKETPCAAPSMSVLTADYKESQTIEYEFPTDDTVPVEKLKLLEYSTDLKQCLENPYVRELLKTLDESSCPDILIKEYMTEPIFTEFADACLKVVQPKNDSE